VIYSGFKGETLVFLVYSPSQWFAPNVKRNWVQSLLQKYGKMDRKILLRVHQEESSMRTSYYQKKEISLLLIKTIVNYVRPESIKKGPIIVKDVLIRRVFALCVESQSLMFPGTNNQSNHLVMEPRN
jgi:hypothetical protein